MAWISYKFDEIVIKTGLILLLFLPQLLLALTTTIDRTNVKILVQHPSLVLLPVFTFFTFSRKEISCCGRGQADSRIQFSRFFSLVNIVITTICLAPGIALYYYQHECIQHDSVSFDQASDQIIEYASFVLGICFTLLFLYIEKLPCFKTKIFMFIYDPINQITVYFVCKLY